MTRVEWTEGRWLEASGGLWLAQSCTLILADAHLGYSLAQRRRGELGPAVDPIATERLEGVIERLSPRTVVFAGDLVHAPNPSAVERQLVSSTLARLAQQTHLIAVRGNHDRRMARDFAGAPVHFVEEWREEDLLCLHGDGRLPAPAPGQTLILGHLHPCRVFRDAAGAKQRVRAFLASPKAVILPAFSPFAAGYDLARGLPRGWEPHFAQDATLWGLSGRGIHSLGAYTPATSWTGARGAAASRRAF